MAKLVAKKSWKGGLASAYIQVSDTGEVKVIGNFKNNPRKFPGPQITLEKKLSGELLKEALQSNWENKPSPDLQRFYNEVWKEAQIKNSWFDYEI